MVDTEIPARVPAFGRAKIGLGHQGWAVAGDLCRLGVPSQGGKCPPQRQPGGILWDPAPNEGHRARVCDFYSDRGVKPQAEVDRGALGTPARTWAI